MKREKTRYEGVYYRLQKKLGSEALEKVYYIFYRQGGRGTKQVEERVGRESEGMTAASRAARVLPRPCSHTKTGLTARKAHGRPILA